MAEPAEPARPRFTKEELAARKARRAAKKEADETYKKFRQQIKEGYWPQELFKIYAELAPNYDKVKTVYKHQFKSLTHTKRQNQFCSLISTEL